MTSGGGLHTRRNFQSRLRAGLLAAALLGAFISPVIDAGSPAHAQVRFSDQACQFNSAGPYSSLQVGIAGTAKIDPLNQFPNTVSLSAVFHAVPILADFGLIAYNFGFIEVGTTQVPMTASLTITASNTVEGSQSFSQTSVATTVVTDPDGIRLTGDETATPLPISFALPPSTWTPTGAAEVTFSDTGSTTTAVLGTFTSEIVCQPGDPSGCDALGTNCITFTPLPSIPFAVLPTDGLRLQHLAPTVALTGVTLGNGAAVALGTLPPLIIDNDGSNTVGWTLSAYVTDFIVPGALDCVIADPRCIPGDNLGWLPTIPLEYRVPAPGTSGVTAGPSSATSGAAWLSMLEAAGPAGVNGIGGLGEVNVLCTAAPGSPSSTVGCGAELFLGIPASTASGDYLGVLVLTIT